MAFRKMNARVSAVFAPCFLNNHGEGVSKAAADGCRKSTGSVLDLTYQDCETITLSKEKHDGNSRHRARTIEHSIFSPQNHGAHSIRFQTTTADIALPTQAAALRIALRCQMAGTA